jgi:hypothetical protein
MGYPSVQLVTRLLAQALTSATPDTAASGFPADQTLGNLLNVGNTLDSNNVTPDVINTFIADSDAEVNATIGTLYKVPLKRKADTEMTLLTDASSSQATFSVSESGILIPGDCLIITDGVNREEVSILALSGMIVTAASNLVNGYSASQTRVVRVKYPDPISFISGRIAAANIYDKFFAAQSDKNESNYGKFFRNMARIGLQEVLQGVTVLNGQQRIGYLTVNPTTIKVYSLPIEGEIVKLEDPGGRS